jgi:hypothetical protein
MNFNTLVSLILKEEVYSGYPIPVLDDKPEFYYVNIGYHLNVFPLERAEDPDCWWASNDESIVDSYDLAIDKVIKLCKDKSMQLLISNELQLKAYIRAVEDVTTQLDALKTIPGKWRVMDQDGDPVDSFTMRFFIGLEVDVDVHKTSSHASEELLGF